MTDRMLRLTKLYTRHYRLYVALRLTRPWNPEHVLDQHANELWRGEVSRFPACVSDNPVDNVIGRDARKGLALHERLGRRPHI